MQTVIFNLFGSCIMLVQKNSPLNHRVGQVVVEKDRDVRCYHVAGLGDLRRCPSRLPAAIDPKPTAG